LDRHPFWHEAVEHVLLRIDVQVVGKATSPVEALDLIELLRPDVLVTAITMDSGEPDGLTCIRDAHELVPHLRTVVLSMHSDRDHVDAAFEAGASACVSKSAHPDDLALAVRQTLEQASAASPPRRASYSSDRTTALTRREREILQLLAEGHSNAQLAKLLWVTEQTIKFHLSNIYRKLNVSNRTEAAHWARVRGLLETPSDPVVIRA
jgi:DNA-binding NarL/FixJ family response regulator